MKRPALIAIGVVGVLVVVALIILSQGPGVVMSPTATSTPAIVSATNAGSSSTLPVYDVAMPDFQGIVKWWNTPDSKPLTQESLNGKVVLVDFWTYSCINCIRTYPFLRSMQAKYADKGLVIVGVHTPEFEFEKNPDNVGREIIKNDLKYPVALDADYGTWNAYHNQYWPASYLFDKQGRLRRVHFGEGEYDVSETAIRSLLEENGATLADTSATEMATPDFSKIVTTETYFGLSRGDAFTGTIGPKDTDVTIQAADSLDSGKWTAEGVWRFTDEYAQANNAGAIFRFKVQANKLHMVMESADGKDKTIEIYVDGKKVDTKAVNASTLYDVAAFPDAAEHTVEIRIKQAGVRFYAATFS